MKSQKTLRVALTEALEKDVGKARDLVTKLFARDQAEKDFKRNAYKAIFKKARKDGDIDTMLEVAPFFGYELEQKDYERCMAVSIKKGRLEILVYCMEQTGTYIETKELAGIFGKKSFKKHSKEYVHKTLFFLRLCPHELKMIRCQLERIPADKLTLEERMILRVK